MKFWGKSNLLVLFCTVLFAGFQVNALSYDYTASIECLAKPHKPQYNGGIIVNPELNHGLNGWSSFGNAKIQHRESEGNRFIVAHGRQQSYDSISQKTYLQSNKFYTFSAWIQVSSGSVPVTAIFKTSSGFIHAGAIVAESNCWSMLKGGLTVDASGPAELYFESKNTSVEIWVDSISLQPFTEKQWKSHQHQSITKTRKSNVKVQAVDEQGKPLANATIIIQQKAPGFPFGVAINKNILTNRAYQNWFTSRPFTVTTFEDEMKWYSTESSQGHEDYSAADALLQFAKQHNIGVRGHNVFWDDPRYQPGWLKSLSGQQLSDAASKRLNSVMGRYKGQVIAWDVCNENLHFNFFESKIGASASAMFYNWALKADGATTLFMNEYNTIEESGDGDSIPAKYLQKLRDIQAFPGNNNAKMAIGLESHFTTPNIPYIRSSIDSLAAAKVPIWITELDVTSGPNQASYLEQILREVHAHPQIQGIVIWSAWNPRGCYRMCLTDNNFKNLPTGDVVDKLIHEFGLTSGLASGMTDPNGFFEASLFQGDYEVKITNPSVANFSSVQGLNVGPTTESQQQLLFQVSA
ncbi:PREDICTED: endo-1 4-beta-xylanase [Prunus dulcis]|uniref:PREDICTED: endo-1 4-beta-xylanase n=1 Tax=Prunus dulcis TaxID=3755 RepID=A0A5E4FRJ2_PRUDU|nr:PREDICTED: endo-1 4-beta-xylanase [Prunus dulcis]